MNSTTDNERCDKVKRLREDLKITLKHSHPNNPRKLCVMAGFSDRAQQNVIETFAEFAAADENKGFDIITVHYNEIIKDICECIHNIENDREKILCEFGLYSEIANVLEWALPNNCNMIAKSAGAAVVLHMLHSDKLRLIYLHAPAPIMLDTVYFKERWVYLGWCLDDERIPYSDHFEKTKKCLESKNNSVEEVTVLAGGHEFSREILLYVISRIN
jgi:hypothetical protein